MMNIDQGRKSQKARRKVDVNDLTGQPRAGYEQRDSTDYQDEKVSVRPPALGLKCLIVRLTDL